MTAKGIYDNYLTDFMYELTKDGVTAYPGGGQAGASQLIAQTNRVTVVATRGDSVKLPQSVPGMELVLINSGANPMAVYPFGGDAINGQASGVSILQMQNSVDVYACAMLGQWHAEVGGGYSGSFFTELSEDNITAAAGGGQVSARLLTSQTSRVVTVATAGDSIKLPPSSAGLELMVINSGANALQVYGSGSDTIDGVAAATGVAQMLNSVVIFVCPSAGAWYSEGLAAGFGGPGLQTLSFANNLTAIGSSQGTSLAVSAMLNRITTAALGTGVVLPASAAGLAITITNRGLNPINVYGANSDVINTVSPVVMQSNATATFVTAVLGQWECAGVGGGFSGSFPTVSSTNNITALAGGAQAGATALTTVINRITTVVTAGDSVRLPTSVAGLQVTVYNAAAVNATNVFPNTGDAINALAANTAFSLPAGKNATFGSAVNGTWHAIVSA